MAPEFAFAAERYWLEVFPCMRRELARWRALAESIPDPQLRRLALAAHLTKSGTVEGAVAFATFVARERRGAAIRALAAFQTAFDYLDLLAEQPTADPLGNGRQLHRALIAAIDPEMRHVDYYAHNPQDEDGGYLRALLDGCRGGLESLPSHGLAVESLRRSSRRIMAYQSYNHGDAHGSHSAFEVWAQQEARAYCAAYPPIEVEWWEWGAAAGSSMPVFALISAAANDRLEPRDVESLELVYHPVVGALNTLLDSLADRQEDVASGQNQLLGYYRSLGEAISRLQTLTAHAMGDARRLPRTGGHALILAALVSFYVHPLSKSIAVEDQDKLLDGIGDFARPTMLVFRARAACHRSVGGLHRLRRKWSCRN